MSRAIYPGSFNPWHKGHEDILLKATQVFDEVIICKMLNPTKVPGGIKELKPDDEVMKALRADVHESGHVVPVHSFSGLLVDAAHHFKADAVIRGLRNGHDLQYEMNMQYWNEDLGLSIPVVFFITDRGLSHISSSALRELKVFGRDGRKTYEGPEF